MSMTMRSVVISLLFSLFLTIKNRVRAAADGDTERYFHAL